MIHLVEHINANQENVVVDVLERLNFGVELLHDGLVEYWVTFQFASYHELSHIFLTQLLFQIVILLSLHNAVNNYYYRSFLSIFLVQ